MRVAPARTLCVEADIGTEWRRAFLCMSSVFCVGARAAEGATSLNTQTQQACSILL